MGPEDDDRDKRADETGGEEPTRELPGVPTGASEDRCSACGAPLVHDQRYCVECGERRGQSRFPVAQPPAAAPPRRRTRVAPAPRPSRVSSGTTLVAGIGVLLLAIGLGVLIGRVGTKTTTTQAAATTPQVITVQGGAGGSAPTTTTTGATPLSKKSKAKAAAAANKAPSEAVQKKATQAAGKVLGNSAHLAPPTVTNGQTCTGSGCQGGKFTGNFFGQ